MSWSKAQPTDSDFEQLSGFTDSTFDEDLSCKYMYATKFISISQLTRLLDVSVPSCLKALEPPRVFFSKPNANQTSQLGPSDIASKEKTVCSATHTIMQAIVLTDFIG